MSAPAATGTSLQQIESELSVLFRRARELLKVNASAVDPSLNVAGYATLARLVDDGPLRASTLVDFFGTDKGTMSRQVGQLEKLGLVRRTPDPDDGRAQVVTATPLGVRRCTEAREAGRARLRERISDWDEESLDTFGGLLHDFNTALTVEVAPAPGRDRGGQAR